MMLMLLKTVSNRGRKKSRPESRTVSKLSNAKINFVFIVVLFVFFGVWCVCFLFQIIMSERLNAQSLSQYYAQTVDRAQRGEILDADGNVLASTKTAYKVVVCPNEIHKGERDTVTDEICVVLEDLDREYVYKCVSNELNNKKQREIQIARGIEEATANRLNQLNLPGVKVLSDFTRSYAYNNFLAQVLGYTDVDGNGQSGLEIEYNKYLAGENGMIVSDKTSTGARLPFGDQERIGRVDGAKITLTVNAEIQKFLEKALKQALEVNNAKNAQGIIMNAKTGAIIAMSTKPDFNPNDLQRDNLEELYALSRNKLVADAYEPGSTFKIITLASGLDSNTIDESYTCSCPGSKEVAGQRIKCWRSAGHGTQNLTQCAENSCNCAFMDIALKMGVDTFYDYIDAFGFGNTTGSGLPSEGSGIVTHRKGVADGDLARIGFGQSISMTPIQLVTAVSAAVNGGNLMQPYIVDSIVGADGTVIQDAEPTAIRRVVSEETSATVRKILASVVENGSGKNAKIDGYRIGGKTGTAQKYENGKVADGKLIASFIGVAPIDDPQYVCLILVDEPQVGTIFGSTVAAPFVKEVLEDTLEYVGIERENRGETVAVPDVIGKSVAAAEEKLAAVGLSGKYQAADKVINQVPAAGTVVPAGTEVLLYTEKTTASADKDIVEVPRLVGLTRYEAAVALKALGLVMEIEGDYSGENVTYQYPYYGEEIRVGGTVKIKFR